MLQELRLENWKSFGAGDLPRQRLRFSPLTLLVGPNASGKSNVLDALRFLQGMALDHPLGDVLRGRWEGQRQVWPGIRGQLPEAPRTGHASFTIESRWSIGADRLLHLIGVDVNADAALAREQLTDVVDHVDLFDTHADSLASVFGRTPGGAIRVAMKSRGQGRSSSQERSASASLLGQIEAAPRVDPAVLQKAHALRQALREIVFLDIQPSRMRDYRPDSATHIGLSGENVSPVLAALPPEQLEDVRDWLSELCTPPITRIDFDRTKLREVMLFVEEEGGGRVSARSMSDGTLRFLGEITALLTAPPNSTMVLEEPDVGLHPSRIHLLAELLEHVTSKRGVQVVATTHSPTLLAHLSPAVLQDVLVLGRDASTGCSVASRIGDLEHVDTLLTTDHLERLISTGWLERAL